MQCARALARTCSDAVTVVLRAGDTSSREVVGVQHTTTKVKKRAVATITTALAMPITTPNHHHHHCHHFHKHGHHHRSGARKCA
jgi:hypothetical protein